MEVGYKTVAFDTVGRWSLVNDSDYFISLNRMTPYKDALIGGVTEFENMLMDSTLLARRNSLISKLTGYNPNNNRQEEFPTGVPVALFPRRIIIIKYNIDKLSQIPALPRERNSFMRTSSLFINHLCLAEMDPINLINPTRGILIL